MARCGPAEPIRLVPLPPGVDYPWRTSLGQPDAHLRAAFRRALLVVDNAHAGAEFYAAQWRPLSEMPQIEPTEQRPERRPSRDSGGAVPDTAESETETIASASTERDRGGEGSRINVNTASADDLESLRGIGPSLAARIIAARPYSEVEGLLSVRGIGPATLDRFREYVTVR